MFDFNGNVQVQGGQLGADNSWRHTGERVIISAGSCLLSWTFGMSETDKGLPVVLRVAIASSAGGDERMATAFVNESRVASSS